MQQINQSIDRIIVKVTDIIAKKPTHQRDPTRIEGDIRRISCSGKAVRWQKMQ